MTHLTLDERVAKVVAKMPPISDAQAQAAARILASVEPSTCDHVLMRPACASCESRFQARTEKASA